MVTIEIIGYSSPQSITLKASDADDETRVQMSMSPELSIDQCVKITLEALSKVKSRQMYEDFMKGNM